MARFTFTATDEHGAPTQGTIQAVNRSTALQVLSKRYPLVTQLKEARARKSIFARFRNGGLTSSELLALFQQMAVGMSAGLTLKHCLESLARDTEKDSVRAVVDDLCENLTAGLPLSEAMALQPQVFRHYQCKLVRAGEASGKMPDILGRLSADLENGDQLSGQVRAALAYPLFVLMVALALAAFLLAWGVPQVEKIYSGMGARLPLPTRILVFIGMALSSYWYIIIALGVGTFAAIRYALRKPELKARLETVLMRTYPIGDIYHNLNVAFFSRTLGMLYASGLPLNQGMEILEEAMTSVTMARVVKEIRQQLVAGLLLSTGMRQTRYFPSLAVDMVLIGEDSGSLEKMLSEVDRFYSRRCEAALRTLTALIEPVMTVFIGFILGGIILGLGLPFLNLPALML